MSKEDPAVVAEVREIVEADTTAALYVFRVIWERQTAREKYYGRYTGSDGRGFQEFETPAMNALYRDLEDRDFRVSAWQADTLRRDVPKYARQYVEDSNDKHVDPLARLPRAVSQRSASGRKVTEKRRHPKREELSVGERNKILASLGMEQI